MHIGYSLKPNFDSNRQHFFPYTLSNPAQPMSLFIIQVRQGCLLKYRRVPEAANAYLDFLSRWANTVGFDDPTGQSHGKFWGPWTVKILWVLTVVQEALVNARCILDGNAGVLTIYLGKPEILVGKSNGSPYFVWEASENMGCDLRGCHISTLLSLFGWFGCTLFLAGRSPTTSYFIVLAELSSARNARSWAPWVINTPYSMV